MLIKCQECSREISDTAPACPHCGYQLRKPARPNPFAHLPSYHSVNSKQPSGALRNVLTAGAVILSLVVVGAIFSRLAPPGAGTNSDSTASSLAPSSATPMPTDQTPDTADLQGRLTLVLGHMTVLKQLRDPESAEWQAEHIRSVRGRHVLCGEVNARNGFNGRAGFQQFVFVAEAKSALLAEQASTSAFQRQWKRWCV